MCGVGAGDALAVVVLVVGRCSSSHRPRRRRQLPTAPVFAHVLTATPSDRLDSPQLRSSRPPMTLPCPHVDHLVVAAATLAQGVRWCEGVLGVTPGPGGVHPLMGTHNRLARLAGVSFPGAYLEIIAIDDHSEPTKPDTQRRWFGLDDPQRQARLAAQGPQLIHWVARVPDLSAALAQCAAQGVDTGPAHRASRPTPQGLLEWGISIPVHGHPALQGIWPTLIQWGDIHPSSHMAASGLSLQALHLQHPQAPALNALWRALGGADDRFESGDTAMAATLCTPRGLVRLDATLDSTSPDMI